MGLGLVEEADTAAGFLGEVFADFYAVGLLDFFAADFEVGGEVHVVGAEAGVGEREDEAGCRFEDFAEGVHHGVDGDHVHHGHAADGGVEAIDAEGEELGHVGGVDVEVFDLAVLGGGAGAGRSRGISGSSRRRRR